MKSETQIVFFSIIFMLLFLSFSAASSLMANIYDEHSYKNLGQLNTFTIYITFTIGNLFGKKMSATFKTPKNGCAFACLFYAFFMLTGSYTYYCHDKSDLEVCKRPYIYVSNILASMLLGGFGGTILWTSQFRAISSQGKNTGKLFGLFYSIFQFRAIVGNAFNYVYYGLSSNVFGYFSIFMALCLLCSLAFVILPVAEKSEEEDTDTDKKDKLKSAKQSLLLSEDTNNRESQGQTIGSEYKQSLQNSNSEFEETIQLSDSMIDDEEDEEAIARTKKKQENESVGSFMKKVIKLAFNKEFGRVIPFLIMAGILQGLMATFFYKITKRTLEGKTLDEINQKIALTMIVTGCGGLLSGLFFKKTLDKANLKVYMIVVAFLFLVAQGMMWYIYYNPVYYYCFVVIALMGGLASGANSIPSTIFSKDEKNKVESFSVFKILQSLTTAAVAIMSIKLDEKMFLTTVGIWSGALFLLCFRFKNKSKVRRKSVMDKKIAFSRK